jgi:hypothetical protein
MSAAGELLATYGSCQATDYLDYPSAIAADASGRVYVADLNQHVIKVLAASR